MTLLDGTQKGYLRGEGQATKLKLAINKPVVVFSRKVLSFTTLDKVIEVAYYGTGTGAYGDVKPEMTLWVGNAPETYDVGMARIRADASTTKLFIGETSEIAWANDLYLTVVDDYRPWVKHMRTDDAGVMLADSAIPYNGHNLTRDPIVIMGSDAVAELTGASVDVTFDASPSAKWATVAGTSISGYSWSAPGSTGITGGSTATPTIHYDTGGRYHVFCTVSYLNGKSQTGHRYVFIFSAAYPASDLIFRSCEGRRDKGGWDFEIELSGTEADIDNLPDGTMLILFAQDYYGATKVSIGHQAGRENIVCQGWVDKESLVGDPEGGSAIFHVAGPYRWLDTKQQFADEIDIIAGDPTTWREISALTVDKAIWQIASWRSNIGYIMDIYPTEDTRYADQLQSEAVSIWSQLGAIGGRILAEPRSDQYGRIFVGIDAQFISPDDRDYDQTVMEITKDDMGDKLEVERHLLSEVSQIIQSGLLVAPGMETQAIYSLSPGHIPKVNGSAIAPSHYLVGSQAQANEMAGLQLGNSNRPMDFSVSLAQNNRALDICPEQYVDFSFEEADTPRQVSFDGRAIPRVISYKYYPAEGYLEVDSLNLEPETFPENAVDGDIPIDSGFEHLPVFPPIKIPRLPPFIPPILPPPNPEAVKNMIMAVDGINKGGIVYTKDFDSDAPHWFSWNYGLPVTTNAIMQLETSMISGKSFVVFNPNVYNWQALGAFVSTGFGLPWTKFYTPTQILTETGQNPGGNGEILAMGINRNASDEVGMLIHGHYGASHLLKFMHGSSGGMSPGATFPTMNGYGSQAFYGSNKWAFTLQVGTFVRLDRNLASIEVNTAMGGYFLMTKASLDGKKLILWDTVSVKTTADMGDNFTTITTPSQPDSTAWREHLATDPSGLYMMYCPHLSIAAQKSSDGGTTWSALGTPSIIVNAIWNLGDPLHWVLQGGIGIWYTPDFGTTWIDKTGDLRTLLGINWVGLSIRSLPG